MPNSIDDTLGLKTLSEKLGKPNFSEGVLIERVIEYFEDTQNFFLAQQARKVQKLANYPVKIVTAPPGIAAYITPGKRIICYSLFTLLDPVAVHEEIVAHEEIHLKQVEQWGIKVPGFDVIEKYPYLQALFSAELGLASLLRERDVLEGFTESLATKKARFNPDCAYNQFQVPLIDRLDKLVLDITGVSLKGKFGAMNVNGSDTRFRMALLETANYLVFENSAESITGRKLDSHQKKTVRAIGRCIFFGENRIVSPEDAKKILLHTSIELIKIPDATQDAVRRIIPYTASEADIIARGISVSVPELPIFVAGGPSDLASKVLSYKTADRIVRVLGDQDGEELIGLSS